MWYAAVFVQCAKLFSQSTAVALGLSGAGTSASGFNGGCAWATDYYLVVQLGSASTLLPGDNVTLAAPSVAFSNLHTSAWQVSVPVTLGAGILAPSAHLSAPASSSLCDDIVLDTVGSTGRLVSFAWSVAPLSGAAAPPTGAVSTAVSTTVAAIGSVLSVASIARTTGRVVVPKSALQSLLTYVNGATGGPVVTAVKLNFTVVITDALGAVSVASTSTTVNLVTAPSLQIDVPSSVPFTSPVVVTSSARLVSCQSAAVPLPSTIVQTQWFLNSSAPVLNQPGVPALLPTTSLPSQGGVGVPCMLCLHCPWSSVGVCDIRLHVVADA